MSSKRTYTRFEKLNALRIIEIHGGNVSSASRELNIPRPTLISWLSEAKKEVSEVLPPDEHLTAKQNKFADEYATNGMNARKAALAAGYAESTANVDVYRSILENPRIKARIDARLAAAAALSPEEVKGTIADHMRGDVSDFLSDNGYFSLDKAKENGVTHLIKKIEYDDFGGIKKFEIESPQKAAFKLFDHYFPAKLPDAQNQVTIGQLKIIYVNDWRNPQKEVKAAIEGVVE